MQASDALLDKRFRSVASAVRTIKEAELKWRNSLSRDESQEGDGKGKSASKLKQRVLR
jgi:hypothetical protein